MSDAPDTEDLVKRLRERIIRRPATGGLKVYEVADPLCARAADAIETLTKERDAGREWMRCAWREFNAIRAKDGAPEGVSESWWSQITDALGEMLGEDALPWMTKAAKLLVAPYEAQVSCGAATRNRPTSFWSYDMTTTDKDWIGEATAMTGVCNCDEAFVWRGLADPDCRWHDLAEDIARKLEAAFNQGVSQERERAKGIIHDHARFLQVSGTDGICDLMIAALTPSEGERG